MCDKVLEPFGAQEYFCNGFADYEVNDGVMTCTGYRTQQDLRGETVRVAVVKLAFPVVVLEAAIERARRAKDASHNVNKVERELRRH